jgi:hypothetical protein
VEPARYLLIIQILDQQYIEWFTENLPKDMQLDGELWGGRGTYNAIQVMVRTRGTHDEWRGATFKGIHSLMSIKSNKSLNN